MAPSGSLSPRSDQTRPSSSDILAPVTAASANSVLHGSRAAARVCPSSSSWRSVNSRAARSATRSPKPLGSAATSTSSPSSSSSPSKSSSSYSRGQPAARAGARRAGRRRPRAAPRLSPSRRRSPRTRRSSVRPFLVARRQRVLADPPLQRLGPHAKRSPRRPRRTAGSSPDRTLRYTLERLSPRRAAVSPSVRSPSAPPDREPSVLITHHRTQRIHGICVRSAKIHRPSLRLWPAAP